MSSYYVLKWWHANKSVGILQLLLIQSDT